MSIQIRNQHKNTRLGTQRSLDMFPNTQQEFLEPVDLATLIKCLFPDQDQSYMQEIEASLEKVRSMDPLSKIELSQEFNNPLTEKESYVRKYCFRCGCEDDYLMGDQYCKHCIIGTNRQKQTLRIDLEQFANTEPEYENDESEEGKFHGKSYSQDLIETYDTEYSVTTFLHNLVEKSKGKPATKIYKKVQSGNWANFIATKGRLEACLANEIHEKDKNQIAKASLLRTLNMFSANPMTIFQRNTLFKHFEQFGVKRGCYIRLNEYQAEKLLKAWFGKSVPPEAKQKAKLQILEACKTFTPEELDNWYDGVCVEFLREKPWKTDHITGARIIPKDKYRDVQPQKADAVDEAITILEEETKTFPLRVITTEQIWRNHKR